ncbi:LysR family transcriptional regulator, partial [Pseudomonas akapageensis]|uniref:LysR family transcriptional regulator n=1 Tax=Pseudomonas akapageensis TaxID=2609961 RepID=UPI001C49AF3A
RVSDLEEHLGMRLLLRGNRKLVLTDAGHDYVASCRRILAEIAQAERTASGEYHAPQGELIISAPAIMGKMHVVPVVVEFLRTYADIRVRLQLTDRNVNLLEEHVDLAIRFGELPDSSMIATRIALLRQVLCASPTYVQVRGAPSKPDDLVSHDCVTYEGFWTGNYWAFGTNAIPQAIRVSSRLVVDSSEAAIIAATAGAGIARALSYQVDNLVETGALVTLLEAHEPAPMPVNLIYPSQRQVPLKLRAFLDFSVPRLRERLGYKSP